MSELRDYQTQAVDDLRASLAKGNRSPVFVLPTGAGKTHIAAHLIRSAVEKGNYALFLAPRRELIYQTSEKLQGVDVNHGVIMAGEPRSMFPEVQVACIPTLYRRAIQDERMLLPRANLVLVDEAHLSISKTTRAIVDQYVEMGACVIGLTATPCRTDGAGLGLVYDDLVEGPTVAELTGKGHLVPARYFGGEKPDLDGVKVQAGDYNQKQLGERVNTVELVGDVVENWARLAWGRQTFVFAVSVAHSRALCEQFQQAGVKAEHLDGHTPNDERQEILDRLRSGETQVLVNCEVLTYGVDFPPVSCIVLAKPTKSIARYMQMVGRGLRTYPGKSDCLVIDHADAVLKLGFVDDPMPWSLDGKEKVQDRMSGESKEPDPITCGNCSAEFRPAPECPKCGHQMVNEAKDAIEAHEAELQEIKRNRELAEGVKHTREYKQEFWSQILGMAEDRGKNRKWCLAKYREKFGVWPRGLNDAVSEPGPEVVRWEQSRRIAWAKRKAKEAANAA